MSWRREQCFSLGDGEISARMKRFSNQDSDAAMTRVQQCHSPTSCPANTFESQPCSDVSWFGERGGNVTITTSPRISSVRESRHIQRALEDHPLMDRRLFGET